MNGTEVALQDRVAEVANRPTFQLDDFEKVQRSLLNDLEEKLIVVQAKYEEDSENIADKYDAEIKRLHEKIDGLMTLIKKAEAMVEQYANDKKYQLQVLKETHERHVDAQQRMIKFQRDGLERLRG